MKIQLDYDSNIIRLESGVNLKEFTLKMKSIIPEKEHDEWTLETNLNTIEWVNPIQVPLVPHNPTTPYTPYPNWWENQPTYSLPVINGNLTGVHNLVVK